MHPKLFELLGSMPHLLDFPVTIFIVWAGLRVWRESKELITEVDERHLEALQDITRKSDLALRRVTEGMQSIREEVLVFRAEVVGRLTGFNGYGQSRDNRSPGVLESVSRTMQEPDLE